MKGLKRKGLVLGALALPILCHAEIKPLTDAAMSNVTGKGGVTIQLETRLTMNQVKYTDQGSLAINNITIGGANTSSFFPEMGIANLAGSNPGNTLDNIKLNIDLARNGDAIINMLPISFYAVDFKITTGQWNLEGTGGTTTVANNLNLVGLLGSGTVRVINSSHKISVRLGFAVSDFDVDLPIMAVGIRNMRITGENYDPNVPQVLDLFSDNTFYIYKTISTMPGSNHESMAIDVPSFKADMTIGSLLVGGQTIGSVKLDNFELHNTTFRVYGH